MENNFTRTAWCVPLCLALLLSGCGGVSLWPFGRDEARERPRTPSNASEYRCDGEKRFYLRRLDNGGAAWLILADREVRLDKVTASTGTRYSNGIAVLNIDGNEATLVDGATSSYRGCKKVGK